MKFLHTADLHLGKRMNDISLNEDQKAMLSQIADIAKANRVDGILISGDIYQKSIPAGEAVGLFSSFLTELKQHGFKIFMISGNHDNGERISYLGEIIRTAEVFVTGEFSGELQPVILNDEYGTLNVFLLPFIKPIQVRKYYPDENIATYEDAVHCVLSHANINTKERNVLLCHQFITGAETSDSEELIIGGLEQMDGRLFDDFDYVAAGHIHKPQSVPGSKVRYAGSPLKYSFSEAGYEKSVTIVEIEEKGSVQIKSIPLLPVHDVREVSGSFRELMEMDYSEDYVRITVTDEFVVPDARISLLTVFPNMMKFGIRNSKTESEEDVEKVISVEEKTIAELFADFYSFQNGGEKPTEKHMKVLEEMLKNLEEGDE